MDHDQDQAGWTHLFWNANGDISNVCLKLEKELQRMYPNSAKTMELSSRLEKVQDEFMLLLDECYYLVMEPSSPTHNEKPIKTITKGKPKEIEKERVSNKWKPNAVKKRAPGQFEVIRAPNQFRVIPAPDQFEVIRAPNQFRAVPAPDQYELIRAPNQFKVVPTRINVRWKLKGLVSA